MAHQMMRLITSTLLSDPYRNNTPSDPLEMITVRITSHPGFVDCTAGLIAQPLMEVISCNYSQYPLDELLIKLDEFDEFEDLLFDELIINLDEFR